jgi:hypothetical protein
MSYFLSYNNNKKYSNNTKMKKLLLLVLAFAFLSVSNRLVAQEKNEARTMLGDGASVSTENLGFFVAPAFGITSMDGSSASLFNLRGGLNIKDKLSFGAYFSTSLNEINPGSETVPGVYMDYWTGLMYNSNSNMKYEIKAILTIKAAII